MAFEKPRSGSACAGFVRIELQVIQRLIIDLQLYVLIWANGEFQGGDT